MCSNSEPAPKRITSSFESSLQQETGQAKVFLGEVFSRCGLAIVLLWIGGLKFTPDEAMGIKLFVENSPLMSFMYHFITVQQFSSILGVVEITTACLLLSRIISPKLSILGSIIAVVMFLTTLSFMVTTPGVFSGSTTGMSLMLTIIGQFLIKDAALLGISIQLLLSDLKALKA